VKKAMLRRGGTIDLEAKLAVDIVAGAKGLKKRVL